MNYMFALTNKVSLLGKSIMAGSHLPRMLCNTAPEATGTTSHVELVAIWLFSSKIGLTLGMLFHVWCPGTDLSVANQ